MQPVLHAQTLKLSCTEKEKKNEEGKDPVLVKTCYLKNFKFITTSYPDYAGRYFHDETEVFVKVKNRYTRTTNAHVFNSRQAGLLALINSRIQADFKVLKADKETRECLADLDSVPAYTMDELQILFNRNEIWFVVSWGLNAACRAVDGTIVTFKIKEISRYLN